MSEPTPTRLLPKEPRKGASWPHLDLKGLPGLILARYAVPSGSEFQLLKNSEFRPLCTRARKIYIYTASIRLSDLQ